MENNLFKQLFRFAVVGVINTGIDLVVLNLLIWFTGVDSGWQYSVFKGISFLIALTNSYFMNKYWTFAGAGTNNKVIEISEFIIVSVIGFLINVGVASFVVNVIPHGALNSQLWANFGALCGTAIGLIWNFIGYKLIVFEKKNA